MDEEEVVEGEGLADDAGYIEDESGEEKLTFLQKQRLKNQRNAENNEKNIRAAASILKDKGIPYASAIAAGVDTADKISGGRSTRLLGHAVNLANKMPGVGPAGGRRIQRLSNKLGESGAADMANNISNIKQSKSGTANNGGANNSGMANSMQKGRSLNNNRGEGQVKMNLPPVVKKIAIIAIPFILVALAILMLMGAELDLAAEGIGSYTYGTTCTTVTVENTGCDENGNNCTLIYDGKVQLEDYIAGIVAAEVGNVNNKEFYKLAAITTRTYIFSNISDNCKVEGNKKFKNYMNVEDSPNSSLIKQAVADTEKLIILERDELIHADYCEACVVTEDDENYYIRYGSRHYDETKLQAIPKTWANNNSIFGGTLQNLYSTTDQNDTNAETKKCPTNNNDYGLSQIGAYYLITEQNYTYQSVLEYYYGVGVEVVTNEFRLSGADGFINPTSKVHCSSPFGTRIHPVKKVESHHGGLDIGIAAGNTIYAANDGVVSVVRKDVTAINNCDFGYGNYIIIEHEDGLSTLYAHIKYDTIPEYITVGSTVKQGKEIGQVGSTGCSTGPHLHYEVREYNVQVDPTDYMDLTDATGTCKR